MHHLSEDEELVNCDDLHNSTVNLESIWYLGFVDSHTGYADSPQFILDLLDAASNASSVDLGMSVEDCREIALKTLYGDDMVKQILDLYALEYDNTEWEIFPMIKL